jgi:hypothetical protein
MVSFSSVHRKRQRQKATTVEPAAIRGLMTTFLASVGCLTHSRPEYALGASERCRGFYHTRAASLPMPSGNLLSARWNRMRSFGLTVHGGHGHRALQATQGLQGFHHRVEAPGFDPLVECRVEPLEACGGFRNGTDICLKDKAREQ